MLQRARNSNKFRKKRNNITSDRAYELIVKSRIPSAQCHFDALRGEAYTQSGKGDGLMSGKGGSESLPVRSFVLSSLDPRDVFLGTRTATSRPKVESGGKTFLGRRKRVWGRFR